jgi:hypothetical protein
MRHRFLLIPAALIASAPAVAEDYMTLQQAQQRIFPGASFKPADFKMTIAQISQLMKVSGVSPYGYTVKMWRVSTGGWFYLDNVEGRGDRILYGIGINEDGTVKAIEIMVCTGTYSQIRADAWRGQFKNRKHGLFDINHIDNISGTTLSVTHIAEGVKRVLATHALFVAPGVDH